MNWIVPDVSLFTQTEWLVYGSADWAQLLPVFAQAMIYLILLSSVALFDFYRKNF